MRRYIKVLAVVSILLLSVLVFSTVAVAAEKSHFVGAWEGIDAYDGSYQIMQIRGGGNGQYVVILQDSVCSGCGESQPSCKGLGKGIISGGVLTADLTVHAMGCPNCPCHGATAAIVFTYDSCTDTITDNVGTTWTRVERP